MNFPTPDQRKQQLLVWWALWLAFQTGVFMMNHFLGPQAHRHPVAPAPADWRFGAAPFAASVAIRFLVLPLMKNAQAALPVFVAGIALAEATFFLGLYVFPAHQHELFMLSAVGIFQFIPIYARRFFKGEL